MTTIVEELTSKARSLPAEDRARLAEDLLSSLQEETDPAVEAAWDAEIRRRLDEVEAGTVKLTPAAEVFAEVRKMLKCAQPIPIKHRDSTCFIKCYHLTCERNAPQNPRESACRPRQREHRVAANRVLAEGGRVQGR